MKHSRIPSAVLAAVLTLLTVLALATPAAAASVPEKPTGDDVYVLDRAGILSEAAEREMQATGKALFAMTGAQVVVLTTDDRDLYDLEDFCYEVFSAWGIGSKERNNGLLLVMNAYTEDYWAMAGYGIDDVLNAGRLGEMLDEYLEPDFAVGDYTAGARKWYAATASFLADYYDAALEKWDGVTYLYEDGGEPASSSGGISAAGILFLLVIIVLVLVIVSRLRSAASAVTGTRRSRSFVYSPHIIVTPPLIPHAGSHGSRIGGFGGSHTSSFGTHSSGGFSSGGSHSSFGGGSHGFGGGGTHGGGAGRH